MKDNMIRRYSVAMVCAAVIGITPMVVHAGEGDQTAASPFIQQFDQDGDGLVSAGEFPGGESQFNHLDTNGDGYVDASEAPRRPPRGGPGGPGMMNDFDADGDGRISAEEFPGPADHFEDLDADADGYLSAEELRAAGPGPRPQAGGFTNDDADNDGKVSSSEFSGPEELFSRLDTDGDGYITQEEARMAPPPPGRPEGDGLKPEERQ